MHAAASSLPCACLTLSIPEVRKRFLLGFTKNGESTTRCNGSTDGPVKETSCHMLLPLRRLRPYSSSGRDDQLQSHVVVDLIPAATVHFVTVYRSLIDGADANMLCFRVVHTLAM